MHVCIGLQAATKMHFTSILFLPGPEIMLIIFLSRKLNAFKIIPAANLYKHKIQYDA